MQTYDATVSAARALGVDSAVGLDPAAVERARAEHGENRLPEVKPRRVWSMFLAALSDKTLLILIGAALLSLGVELLKARLQEGTTPHYIDGVAILAAVLIASLVTTLNEARAAKEFRLLNKAREDIPIKVLRGGHVRSVSIYDLVVGDVVYFDPGDRLPADGRLLSGVDVTVDQSTLTGESVPVHKDADDLELKGGTVVSTGSGAMLLEAVGARSEMGRLQLSLTDTDEEPTPLQERLSRLADRIGLFGLGAAVLTFGALTASYVLRAEGPVGLDLETGGQILSFLIIAVTIVVVAVPEGLPLAVTISLAYSVRKMAKDNNLVRKLASCETMGAATVVCSDKTGTLTRNRMTVVKGWISGALVDGERALAEVSGPARERFSEVASVNATAFLEEREDGVTEYVGNPTECALLAQVKAWGEDWRGRRDAARALHQFGFTSDRKRMSTLVQTEDGRRLLVKGAPEVVLALSGAVATNGAARPLTEADRAAITEAVTTFSAEGHRTLALAYRDLPAADTPEDAEHLEQALTLLAVVAIADPVRPEVKDAVAACRSAGVDVKMVTGDNHLTAASIAEQIGLMRPDDVVLEGPEFRAKSDDEVKALLPRLRVLARSVPSDKLRLVSLLKAEKAVVAVTGDGTNDAPAMKAADVGFSMGLTGTEVAKEASDIVLLDDNFASIVNGILWGRSIFENIRKFLQFQLTVNVVALSTAFIAAVFGVGIPLNTVQLLWVNLIMDTMAALALATEPPDRALFQQPPHGRHAPLITKSMWTSVLAMGGVMLAILMATMFTDWLTPAGITHEARLTFVFNTFVMMQVFNELNARSTRFDRGVLRHLAESHLFIGVMVATVAAQVAIVQLGGAFFRTVPLSLELWGRSVTLGASMLVAGFALRQVGRRVAAPTVPADA
ncbi:MAG: calcium-translocating P-type ATPase, PMCA-type [Deltaproteobacteria bacterium]|nr:calcium-translocating P-type ATPase, PMCA-type [Deltaproteobacteria bacterium]